MPVIAVVTNIDNDHMETYEHDFAKLKQAFVEFLARLPFYGAAIAVHRRSQTCAKSCHSFPSRLLTYGFAEDAQVRAHRRARGRHAYAVYVSRAKARADLDVTLNLPGHAQRRQRAGGDCSRRRELGRGGCGDRRRRWREFTGVGRRFARHGELPVPAGGHLHAGRRLWSSSGRNGGDTGGGARRVSRIGAWCLRSSRIATRARATVSRISCKVLSTADVLLLAEVYPAGEAPIVAADGRALAHAIRVAGKVEPIFVESIDEMPAAMLDVVRDGDVVISDGRRLDRSAARRG